MKSHLATFRVDVTVPLGHGLCGGWIKPAAKIDTPLYCLGMILMGEEAPVVLATVDWTGVCNDAHTRFVAAIAKAAHTTPERVALHSVHQHNAPFVDITGQQLIATQKDLPACCDLEWFQGVQKKVAGAIGIALKSTQPVSHIQYGQARVEKVASNRRILDKEGKLIGWRGSSCKDAKLREMPEGLVDPWLKTISFLNGETKMVTLQWYATHPMSYYGDGVVNYDFAGMAREKRTQETECAHIYFTGCAGNIAAGKYNDGAPERRAELAERLFQAMRAAEQVDKTEALEKWEWRSLPVHLPPRTGHDEASLLKTLADAKQTHSVRARAALQLSYLKRCQAKVPIILNGMVLNRDHRIIHLPGECFLEYQIYARSQLPDSFVCVAAYGDGGPWYIPTAEAYPQGGYEPSAAFVDPGSEKILQEGIKHFLRG